jgi:uncharacterized repeat protein (TIGR01451 family)
MPASAATMIDLGAAADFAVLAGTPEIRNIGDSVITGDMGLSPATGAGIIGFPPGVVNGTIYAVDAAGPAGSVEDPAHLTDAKNALTAAYIDAEGQAAATIGSELGGTVIFPGAYETADGELHITGTVTLDAQGDPNAVFILQAASTLTTAASSQVVLANDASACNVFWQIGSSATLGTDSVFRGNVLSLTSITLTTNAEVEGRILARNGAVTLDTNQITVPTCLAVAPGSPTAPPLINVRKVPSPLALPAGPGQVTYTYTLTNPGTITMNTITLVDDQCSNTTYVSGDVNGNSFMETNETWIYSCTTTLNETTVNYATARGLGNGMAAVDTAIAQVVVGVPVVPPLINVVKTPSTFNVDFGGAVVTYNYVVTNPGTVALENVTVTDDKCTGVTYVAGDVNSNVMMETSETWNYTCSTGVSLTTTNTAVATGEANGLTAVDTSLATVVVAGSSLPPPLILLTKRPAPVLLPASGGLVTYTLTVTNPGTVALNDVSVSDNRCGAVTFVSGDVNGNSLLETNETWTYTCQQNLTASTTNTATASGFGNGLIVSSIAVASVPVSPALIPPAPILPVTGYGPGNGSFVWMVASIGIFLATGSLLAFTQWKRRT